MKKKLALLLAAVMTLSAIPMSLSASISNTVPFTYSSNPKKTIFPGYETPNSGKYSFTTTQGDNDVEYVGGGFAFDVVSGDGSTDQVKENWTFTLLLTNAKFDFSETNSYSGGGYKFGGSSTTTYQEYSEEEKTTPASLGSSSVSSLWTTKYADAIDFFGDDTENRNTSGGVYDASTTSLTGGGNCYDGTAGGSWADETKITGYGLYDTTSPKTQSESLQNYYPDYKASSTTTERTAGYKKSDTGSVYTWINASGTGLFSVEASGSNARVKILTQLHNGTYRVWLPIYMETVSEVKIKVLSQSPSFLPTAEKTIHTVDSSTAGVSVSYGDVQQGRDAVELDTITIKETSMVLVEDGWMKLSLTSGYVFEDEAPAVNVLFDEGLSTSAYSFNEDYDELYIKVGNFRLIGEPITIELDNIYVSPDDDTADTNYYGTKVKLTVEGTKTPYNTSGKISGTHEKLFDNKISFNVVDFVDYGFNLAFDDTAYVVNESFSGKAEIEAGLDGDDPAEITFEELAEGSWSAERNLDITLTDKNGDVLKGVKFNTFEITGSDKLDSGLEKVYSLKKHSDTSVDFARDKVTFKNSGSIGSNDKGSLTFTVTFNAAANFTGDVYLSVSGRAIGNDKQSLKVATIQAPFTVKTSKTTVPVGVSGYNVSNVVLTENAPEALARGGNIDIKLTEYVNGKSTSDFGIIRFNAIDDDDVDVTAGDLTIKDVDYTSSSLNITVNKASTEESKIEISNLSVGTLSNAPKGDFHLMIGGDSWVETYWIQDTSATGDYENLKKTWGNLGSKDDDYGLFDVEGLVVEKYVEISTSFTADDTVFNKNVRVLIGTTTVIVDGVEQEMPAKSYIDPESNRTLLPLRAVAVAFGLTNDQIVWDPDARTATVLAGSKIITFTIGSHIMMINGVAMPMVDDAGNISKAVINPENDRTYLPMRYLGLAFGVEAIYIEGNPSEAIFNPTDEQIEASKVVKPAVDEVADDEVADDEVADDEVADETADETAADTETPAAE